ncbi:MauE/DoxX family redox-associated membrane protein [Pedobacter alluvionis]|uniref:DoxX-like protein n=1 Tax=Pedobacter alluvionis TaxID=475253 RepID=A0A497XVH5_9SPHI|nr:MauE/DoxX family redox-associated membrane protein [Pedobacter alluvionis]RLJ72634.1 DoxX-like protein [Pedobacter alluvionis]TFB28056.1 hypothetical protein E3V97_23790 [Pedobacter alluvionis]
MRIDTKATVLQVISAAFILLWIYTAGSKLSSFENYRLEMQHQVFSPMVSEILIYIIPAVEILAALLLLFQKTNKTGMIFSALLMTAFTIYIVLIISDYFPKVPCTCGGVIRVLGWKAHLVFNLIFLSAAILALYNTPKREVSDKE